MTRTELENRLKGVKRNGRGSMALCPAHDDHKPSLSINEGNDGRILIHCHAGCSPEQVCAAVGIEPSSLRADNGTRKQTDESRHIVATYDYTDEQGMLLFQVVRYDSKEFRQRRPDGNGGWLWNLNGVRRVPYRLPEVFAADPSKTVLIVEGEKDVDRLATIGLVATTDPGGAGKWRDEYSETLCARKVVILPDNDKPGRKHAEQVANSLHGIAASIKIIELPGLPAKGDVSDWLDAGGTVNDLRRLKDETAEFDPNSFVNFVTSETRSEAEAEPIPWPELDLAALYGLAGDFVRLIGPHTESDPVALLIQFLAAFGNAIGRGAHFKTEADTHHLNIFGVVVGETGTGRKGTSWGQVRQRFEAVDEVWNRDCVVNGLSSGEGLLYHVRDQIIRIKKNRKTRIEEEEIVDPGVSDKRLFAFESELGSVLRSTQRDGNTLSAVIRNLWDSGTHRSLVKNSPIRTTDAHVTIIGHIVRYELLNLLSECESINGFANRFLWLCAKRSKFLPRGGRSDTVNFSDITRKLHAAVEYARKTGEMDFTEEAWQLFESVYMRLETGRCGFLGKVTQRASPYTLRLACLYALLDCSNVVADDHLRAALALWHYAEDSARYIFGERTGDKLADRVLDALQMVAEAGMTQTELSEHFHRNENSKSIARALHLLAETGQLRSRDEYTGEPGRPTKRWFYSPRTNELNESNNSDTASTELIRLIRTSGEAEMSDEEAKVIRADGCGELNDVL